MVSGVGGVAVHGDSAKRGHRYVALSCAAGLALIVDEFALLLDLKDVYWAEESKDIGRPGHRRKLAGRHLFRRPALCSRPAPPPAQILS